MKKPIVFTFLVVFLLALTVVPAFAQDDPCLDRGAFYNDQTDTCDMNTSLTMTIPYPASLLSYPFADQAVSAFVRDSGSAFLGDYSTMGMEFFGPPWQLVMAFTQTQFSPDYLSVQIAIYVYTGGANGTGYYKTFLFDLVNETELTLDDVFQPDSNPLQTIAPLVEADLENQLADMGASEFIQDGTDPTIPENYRSFVLTDDALIFLFDEYQVAPGAAGGLSVSIPLTDLTSILADEFQPQ